MCNIGELRVPASAVMRLHASKPASSPNQKPVFGLSVSSSSSRSLGHAGEALLQAGRIQKPQTLSWTTIQIKGAEISLVETEFGAVLLRRDGWSQQETVILHLYLFEEICKAKKLAVMVFHWSGLCPLLNPSAASSCSDFKTFPIFSEIPSMSQERRAWKERELQDMRGALCWVLQACRAPSQAACAAGDSSPSALGDSLFFLPSRSKERAKGNPINRTVTGDVGLLQESIAIDDPDWAQVCSFPCSLQ